VGRFFREGHCKRQDALVEAVRVLRADLPPGWTVVLAGGIGQNLKDREYYEDVRRAAVGLPVRVWGDIPPADLSELYGHAALYWHAAGLGQDQRKDPATLEHFGITTVEAMAAGCVPLVYDCGGQAEIVRSDVNGYRWRTLAELVSLTRELASEPARRERMSNAAQATARRFARQHFDERAAVLLRPLLQTDNTLRHADGDVHSPTT